MFLDAGGVLVNPNWARVSETLARHGVDVAATALASAEPHAKRRIDTGETIKATNDRQRGWTYFNLVLTQPGVALSDATVAALGERHIYHQEFNLWESVPDDVRPSLAAQDRHRLAAEAHAVAVERHLQGSAARRNLPRDEAPLVQPPAPERSQAAVRRSGCRVFVDAERGREIARDEIDAGIVGAAGDHDASRGKRAKTREVRAHAADRRLVGELDEEVEAALADIERLDAEGVGEAGRRVNRGIRRRRKIELDPRALSGRGQEPAARVESRDGAARELARLPERARWPASRARTRQLRESA